MTFVAIAWRNLLAHRRRTAILVGGIGVGVAGILFFQVMLEGFMQVLVNSAVDSTMGHLQIHAPEFLTRREVTLTVPEPSRVRAALAAQDRVVGVSGRVVVTGLVSSPRNSLSVTVNGIDTVAECSVTSLAKRLVEGNLPSADAPGGIFMGRALARRLKVRMGDKVVIMARDVDGEMAGAALRVEGLFHGDYESLELGGVFVDASALRRSLGLPPDAVHEFAVRVRGVADVEPVRDALRAALVGSGAQVQSWDELAPVVKQQVDMSWVSSLIMFLIVFSAVVFGILNAFMMEIFERIHEFGVIMALGTTPGQVFRMLVVEGLFLGMAGALVGAAGGYVLMAWILDGRLDLSRWAEGMSAFDFGTVVPMVLTLETTLFCVGITVLVSLLATLYPALRAAAFRPVEALRHG